MVLNISVHQNSLGNFQKQVTRPNPQESWEGAQKLQLDKLHKGLTCVVH